MANKRPIYDEEAVRRIQAGLKAKLRSKGKLSEEEFRTIFRLATYDKQSKTSTEKPSTT
jgi:hypothetical protein